MADIRDFNRSPTNLDVQTLTEETVKLLRMSSDALFATLGGQLLGTAAPSRVAGIVSYLTAARSASEASVLYANLPPPLSFHELSSGLGLICEELRREGLRYLTEKTSELREALNNEALLRLSDDSNLSQIQVILMVVAAVLRLPRFLDTISATVTAILLKQGLRNFCSENTAQ